MIIDRNELPFIIEKTIFVKNNVKIKMKVGLDGGKKFWNHELNEKDSFMNF